MLLEENLRVEREEEQRGRELDPLERDRIHIDVVEENHGFAECTHGNWLEVDFRKPRTASGRDRLCDNCQWQIPVYAFQCQHCRWRVCKTCAYHRL